MARKRDAVLEGLETPMKQKVVITIAKPMIAIKGNSDDLPPNLRTQKVISK